MLEPIKTEKLYNIIMRRITELIKDQKLEMGDRLPPERELAAALSVSRASVRQALTALAAQGIICMCHGDGNYISSATDDNAYTYNDNNTLELFGRFLAGSQINPDDILEVRVMLECEAARLCAFRASDEQLSLLEKLLEKNRIKNGDDDSLSNMNKDLHNAIISGANNIVLLRIMDVVWEIMNSNMWPLLKRKSSIRNKQIKLHLSQHERIVEAVCARDEKAAYEEMYDHLVTIKRGMVEVVNYELHRKERSYIAERLRRS